MPKPSTLALRKLTRRIKIEQKGGSVRYADRTSEGNIIETNDRFARQHCQYTLERFIPPQWPVVSRPPVWEVVANYSTLERALPAAVKAKKDKFAGQVLRVRDRRSGDFIMVDALGD